MINAVNREIPDDAFAEALAPLYTELNGECPMWNMNYHFH